MSNRQRFTVDADAAPIALDAVTVAVVRPREPSRSELRALRAVVQHGTIRAAAAALHLSAHTVDAHLDRLREKSGFHHLPQIIVWAMYHGWLDMPWTNE